ncbi:MAG: hypothetical protein U5L45_04925 [Saprospiraceae bacterium]|nr:hypothetical protein [Saprospiraceae bacterium]
MRKLIRGAYRLLIRNKFIRWTWLLSLVLYVVKVGTDRGLAWQKTPSAKTIFTIPPSMLESFMIQNSVGEELTFSRQDTNWLVVKNNVTLRLPDDSVRPYLSLFSNMERLAVKTEANTEGVAAPQWRVNLVGKNGNKHFFSIYNRAYDTLSNENLTFVRLGNERLLNGVRGDWTNILSRNFDDYRNRRLFDFSLNQAAEIAFQSPTDTLVFFRRSLRDSVWQNRNRFFIEPIVFQNYVENLDLLSGGVFYDNDRDLLADRKISNRLIIKTPTDTAIVTAYKLDNFYVVHSSCNPDNYFKIDSTSSIFFK